MTTPKLMSEAELPLVYSNLFRGDDRRSEAFSAVRDHITAQAQEIERLNRAKGAERRAERLEEELREAKREARREGVGRALAWCNISPSETERCIAETGGDDEYEGAYAAKAEEGER